MKNTPPSAKTDLEIHKPVIETMKSIGFGLLNDGETFYKLGYEIDPRGNITFTMNQAYEIHKAVSSERTRLLSVESIDKAIRNIKNLRLKHKDYGYHIHIFANENRGRCGICKMSWKESEQQSIYNQALNDACSNLRQSILSEMEKGK